MSRIALFAAALFLLEGCSEDCRNEVISRIESPNRLHVAVMFQRNCGATTGFSTQISILPQGAEPTGGGNAFRADTGHGAAAPGAWGGPWAEMRWLDDGSLLVRHASGARLYAQEAEVSGVRIDYRPAER